MRRDPPSSLRTAELLGHALPKNQGAGSLALHRVTDPGPEDRPTPAALTAGPAAPVTPPEATAEVDGGEDGHALAAAHTGVQEVAADRTAEVTPEAAPTPIEGDPGLTRMTATRVEVAV